MLHNKVRLAQLTLKDVIWCTGALHQRPWRAASSALHAAPHRAITERLDKNTALIVRLTWWLQGPCCWCALHACFFRWQLRLKQGQAQLARGNTHVAWEAACATHVSLLVHTDAERLPRDTKLVCKHARLFSRDAKRLCREQACGGELKCKADIQWSKARNKLHTAERARTCKRAALTVSSPSSMECSSLALATAASRGTAGSLPDARSSNELPPEPLSVVSASVRRDDAARSVLPPPALEAGTMCTGCGPSDGGASAHTQLVCGLGRGDKWRVSIGDAVSPWEHAPTSVGSTPFSMGERVHEHGQEHHSRSRS